MIRLGTEEDIEKAIDEYLEQISFQRKSLQQHYISVMELVSELYRFSANNEIVMDEFSGDMRKLYGRLLDMEPQSFRKWLLDISFSFRERLLNSRSRSTKSFVLKSTGVCSQIIMQMKSCLWTASVENLEYPTLIFYNF